MNLRNQILLGYWYLVALLVVSAAGAALGFNSLGKSIGKVLEENFESVRASMMMLDALERQDSVVLAMLLGEQPGQDSLELSEKAFFDAVAMARGNITINQEVGLLDDLERRYADFRSARDRLLAQPRERPLRAYESDLLPDFLAVKDKAMDLLDLNHQAMVDADQSAQRKARLHALGHGALVLVALISLALLSQALGRKVLDRLADLVSAARAIASGDSARRATAIHDDELGAVARQLNAVLDRLAESESSLEGRLRQVRLLVLALLHEFPEPAAIVALSGKVVSSTMSADHTDMVEVAARQLPHASAERTREERVIEVGGGAVRLRALVAENTRPVGWLATVRGTV